MKNIAIIGAGYFGRMIAEKLRPLSKTLVATYHQNKFFDDSLRFDFFQDDIRKLLEEHEIDTVIMPTKIEFTEDGGALKSSMERFAAACQGKKIVYISSDGIFDGAKGGYAENDITNPVSNYGRNLKICEDTVACVPDSLIVRTSYLYGYSLGKLDPRLKKAKDAIGRGYKWQSFGDMYKSPINVSQAAEAVFKLTEMNHVGIVHVAGPRMNVFDFIREGMEAFGIPTEKMEPIPMPEDRPDDYLHDTSLDNTLMKKITGIVPMGVKESLRKLPF